MDSGNLGYTKLNAGTHETWPDKSVTFYMPEVKLRMYYGMASFRSSVRRDSRPSVRPGRQKGTCWVQKYPTNVHLWELSIHSVSLLLGSFCLLGSFKQKKYPTNVHLWGSPSVRPSVSHIMSPIHFEVSSSKVKVTVAFNAKTMFAQYLKKFMSDSHSTW